MGRCVPKGTKLGEALLGADASERCSRLPSRGSRLPGRGQPAHSRSLRGERVCPHLGADADQASVLPPPHPGLAPRLQTWASDGVCELPPLSSDPGGPFGSLAVSISLPGFLICFLMTAVFSLNSSSLVCSGSGTHASELRGETGLLPLLSGPPAGSLPPAVWRFPFPTACHVQVSPCAFGDRGCTHWTSYSMGALPCPFSLS